MKKIVINEDSSIACFEKNVESRFQERSKIGMRFLDLWRNGDSRSIEPAKGETLFRIVEFLPNTKKTLMHKTDSVDCAMILEGSIKLILENQELDLCQGDCVIQQSNSHAWVNVSPEPCRIIFFMRARN